MTPGTLPKNATGKEVCWNCIGAIDEGDNYCRHCGFGQGKHIRWVYHWWGIFLLFFCMGPANIYYLHRSPLVRPEAKVWWIIFYTVLTASIIFLLYKALVLMTTFLSVTFNDMGHYGQIY